MRMRMEFEDVDGDFVGVWSDDGMITIYIEYEDDVFHSGVTPATARAIAAELIRLADEIEGTRQ